jgi:hypothetical protein
MNIESLLYEALQLPSTNRAHINALRYILHKEVSVDLKFLAAQSLTEIHNQYNWWITERGLDESCIVGPNDSAATVRKKCKKAFKHGEKVYPMHWIYAVSGSPMASGLGEEHNPYDSPDYALNGFTGTFKKKQDPEDKETLTRRFADLDPIEEEKSSTERVRRYYKRHPEKVRKYLKDTVKDRVARNRDRAKAIKKHGKEKMKNHDVHHPNGPQNGGARLAKKDHGRDKVNEEYSPDVISSTIQEFVNFAVQKLQLQTLPTVTIIPSSDHMTSLGYYDPMTKQINVVVEGRLLADILRTLAHELAHRKQDELGLITNPMIDGATGSPIENNANAIAGILLRQYGQSNPRIFMTEGLLMEGGAHGHLAHPFEDTDLSFDDFDEMISRSLVGNLEKEGPVVEKMDGQNIAFTVRDGKVVFARNKGHVKNRAEKALSAEELAKMFAGRGEISDAFAKAAEDIEVAMSKLSPEEIEQVFGDGRRVMSTEIIYPGTRNVIPYDKTVLVFHGTLEHDDDGEKVGVQNTENGQIIANAVTKANADKQRTFGISGPRTVAISDQVTEEMQQVYTRLSQKLEDLRAQYNLKPSATLHDYLEEWWNEQLTEIESQQGFKFTNQERAGLIARWIDNDKKFGVKNLSDEKKEWFREFEKNDLTPMLKQSVKPVEQVFLTAGVYALKRVVEFLSANNPAMAEELKKQFVDSIRGIQQAGGPGKLQKLEYELARLKELGIDNVVPSEGLIFTYNGNPYKLTGAFAPVNQIIGTMKYDRAPEKPEASSTEPQKTEAPPEKAQDEPVQPETPVQPPKPIAIYPGRFQPYHAGHHVTYEALVEKFGRENVYVVSSDKQDSITSPFGFSDKQEIMTSMFDIPEDRIIQVKNPYNPIEVTKGLPEGTPVIFAVGEKDAQRLGGKYFQKYDPNEKMLGYKQAGYVWIGPPPNLEVNGKEISGTQLRAVMGDPAITDRAKQEIFIKIYGKFDKNIFDKVVKKTSDAEEARKLTDMHGKPEKPTTEPETTPKKGRGKKPDEKALGRAKSVLGQKVRNPKTGRDILVATALKYPEDEPVRKAAERMVQQAMAEKNEILSEGKAPKKLKVYTHIREYTDEDLEYEKDEYFNNERTFEAFPDLADSADELKKLISNAASEVLEVEELQALENSDVGEVLRGENKMKVLKNLISKEKDVKGLLSDIKNKKPIAMPIIIKHTNGYYLLGGNTRLSVLAAIGHTMPVKVLGQASPYPSPYVVGKSGDVKKTGKKKTGNKDLFKKLMQMRITNPETGNQVKVDTAMDYDRLHPAHKAAMAFIRQHMKGISNRAGIPKNRND